MRKILFFILFLLFCGEELSVDVLFCPEDFCAQKISTEIRNAEKKIFVAMYRFTNDGILGVLIERCLEIKECFVILDKAKENENSFLKLQSSNVAVKLQKGKGIMHNKFAVIDGEVVLTGSFNWTYPADKENDENLVIIYSKSIAKEYEKKFIELWNTQ